MLKLLYRIDEVQRLLSFGKTKVYELLKEGELQRQKRKTGCKGKGARVTAASLLRYAKKHDIEIVGLS